MAPLSAKYIASAEKSLTNKIDGYNQQLKVLKKSKRNHNAIKNTIIDFIVSQIMAKFGATEADSMLMGVEESVNSFVSGVLDIPGPGPEGSMSMSNIGMILTGSLLAADRESFFGLTAGGADITSAFVEQRRLLLDEIKTTLAKMRSICEDIDPSWYDETFVKRVNSALAALEGADSNAKSISLNADKYVIDRLNYNALLSKLSSSIVALGDRGNFVVLGNLNSLIDLLVAQVAELSNLSKSAADGLSGLSTSITNFAMSRAVAPVMFELMKQTVESAARVIANVVASMETASSRRVNSAIPILVHSWVNNLSSCREMLSTGVIDVTESAADEENTNTINLKSLINGLKSIGSPVSVLVEVLVNQVLDLIVSVLVNQKNADKVIRLIDQVLPMIDGDMGISGTVTSAILNAPLLRDNENVALLMKILPSIGQDRFADMISLNDWEGIMGVNSNGTTYAGDQASNIEDGMTLDEADLVADISAEATEGADAVPSYNELTDMSIITIEKYKIPELEKLLARLRGAKTSEGS